MSVVIAVVPMCITLSIVVNVTMLPMAIRKCCPLVIVLVFCTWDDLGMGCVLMGSAALIVQQGQRQSWSEAP